MMVRSTPHDEDVEQVTPWTVTDTMKREGRGRQADFHALHALHPGTGPEADPRRSRSK